MRKTRSRPDFRLVYDPAVMNFSSDNNDKRTEVPSRKRKRLNEDLAEPRKKSIRLDIRDDTLNQCSNIESKLVQSDKQQEAKKPIMTSDEKSKVNVMAVVDITDKDVLSGRGGRTNMHAGNRYFRTLVSEYCSAYERATKHMKPYVSQQIVTQIYERGGRFLRRNSDGDYYDIGMSLAKEKTSQALRHRSLDIRNFLDPHREKRNGKRKQNEGDPEEKNCIVRAPTQTKPFASLSRTNKGNLAFTEGSNRPCHFNPYQCLENLSGIERYNTRSSFSAPISPFPIYNGSMRPHFSMGRSEWFSYYHPLPLQNSNASYYSMARTFSMQRPHPQCFPQTRNDQIQYLYLQSLQAQLFLSTAERNGSIMDNETVAFFKNSRRNPTKKPWPL